MFRFTFILTLIASPSFAQTLTGRIVGVSDGDTATLLTSDNTPVKIRLAQIDAPEKKQPFGEKSKQSLSDLIYGKNVSVEVETKDRYQRTVGKIIINGVDVNLEQIKRGLAWYYIKYGHDSNYSKSESQAKALRKGLWAEPTPVAPWDFRHGNKSSAAMQLTPYAATSSTCGNKRFCKEMSSCEEAMMYLKQCGLSKLDRDGDGTPCESICKR
jgi:endonuclease YncB( thermonuclease family)